MLSNVPLHTDMAHFMCLSVANNAKEDLEAVVRLLYNVEGDVGKCMCVIHWCV